MVEKLRHLLKISREDTAYEEEVLRALSTQG